jgi:hypothetical protein
MLRKGTEGLASELASLPSLEVEVLKQYWRRLYECDPPSHVSRTFLVRAVAYRMQEKALGGLKPQVRRMLARMGADAPGARAAASPAVSKLRAGTRLVRDWRGVTHHVVVLDAGVMFRGKGYRSLSEVARVITGSRWSGPRFFGLKGGIKELADDRA